MYISLKWVKDLIAINFIRFDSLLEKLTLSGFEVEEIIRYQNKQQTDIILDIAITPNRSDLYNLNGVKKELLAIFYKSKYIVNSQKFFNSDEPDIALSYIGLIKPSDLSRKSIFKFQTVQKLNSYDSREWNFFLRKQLGSETLSKLIKPDLVCSRMFTTLITLPKDYKVIPLIKKRILASQLESKTDIENLLNLILLETGYPFFIYDLEKLNQFIGLNDLERSRQLHFSCRRAKENEFFAINAHETIPITTFFVVLSTCMSEWVTDPIIEIGFSLRSNK